MDHCKPVVDGSVQLPEYGCTVQTSCGCGCASLEPKNRTKPDFKTLSLLQSKLMLKVKMAMTTEITQPLVKGSVIMTMATTMEIMCLVVKGLLTMTKTMHYTRQQHCLHERAALYASCMKLSCPCLNGSLADVS